MMNPETTTIVLTLAGAGGAGSILGWLAFWLKFSDRVTNANSRAEAAEKQAMDSDKLASEAHTRVTALSAEFGMYRERIANEYVTKPEIREMKIDLLREIEKIAEKLDQVLSIERKRQ